MIIEITRNEKSFIHEIGEWTSLEQWLRGYTGDNKYPIDSVTILEWSMD